jgi:hypothetical protein
MEEVKRAYKMFVVRYRGRKALEDHRHRENVISRENKVRSGEMYEWRTQKFFSGRGGSTNSVEDRGQRDRRSGGGSPIVRGSGGSCNLVQEISFHIINVS